MGKHVHRWNLVERRGTRIYNVDVYCCAICGKFNTESSVKPFSECEGVSYEQYIGELREMGLEEPMEEKV